jgi:phage tail-like protein
MAGEDQVFGNYSFKMEGLKGAESALKFFQADMPGSSVQISNVKHFGENGPAVPLSGGGHQVTWNPITLVRYYDGDTSLFEWYKEVMEKGAVTGETKQDPTITCLSNDQPLFMWKLTGAVPTQYTQNAANAQTHDLMTETITLTYEEADLTTS